MDYRTFWSTPKRKENLTKKSHRMVRDTYWDTYSEQLKAVSYTYIVIQLYLWVLDLTRYLINFKDLLSCVFCRSSAVDRCEGAAVSARDGDGLCGV